MFEKLNYVELSGEQYPIKCDMVVLEQAQEKYGNLTEFEAGLYKFTAKLDEDGNLVKNEAGLIVGTVDEPDMKVVEDALYWMITEGLEIEAEEKGTELKTVTRKSLMRKADASPFAIAGALHDEFMKCYERKNVKTMQNQKAEK